MSETTTSGADGPDGQASAQRSIGEVLSELQRDFADVTISKIRFLESRGLITPHRAPSGYRKFSDADLERLRWILTMQRDHFLPLRVIKERLEAGDTDLPDATADAGGARRAERFGTVTPSTDDLDATELARMAGLKPSQLDQLIKFGLITPHDSPAGVRYSRDELRVARAAAGFLEHGIEARHLKAWKVAADREAGLLEQIVRPVARQASPAAQSKAREVADDLIDMGNTIREALIVKSLRNSLGLE